MISPSARRRRHQALGLRQGVTVSQQLEQSAHRVRARHQRLDLQPALHQLLLDLEIELLALVEIDRPDTDFRALAAVPLHRLPAEAIPYLNESRYCPSNKFHAFVERRFGDHEGGAKIGRMPSLASLGFDGAPDLLDRPPASEAAAQKAGVKS